jgi:hypothetical protein
MAAAAVDEMAEVLERQPTGARPPIPSPADFRVLGSLIARVTRARDEMMAEVRRWPAPGTD